MNTGATLPSLLWRLTWGLAISFLSTHILRADIHHLPTPGAALSGKHVVLSAGHGANSSGEFDRDVVLGLREDIHNNEIVIVWLQRYLANAGARVFTVRERSFQRNQVVVDDDTPYSPTTGGCELTGIWTQTSEYPPFIANGYRYTSVTASAPHSTCTWTPNIPESGDYPVYVFYRGLATRNPTTTYTIRHAGGVSTVVLDQTSYGSQYVYLGTWYFLAGVDRDHGSVSVSSQGTGTYVHADAVRFGGGSDPDNQYPWWKSDASQFLYDSLKYQESGYEDVSIRGRYASYLVENSAAALKAGTAQYSTDWRFLSLHTNAAGGTGTSTFSYNNGRPPAWGSTGPAVYPAGLQTLSDAFASRIQSQFVSDMRNLSWKTNWTDGGAMLMNFGEIRHATRLPAALVELAFHDIQSDVDFLKQDRWRHDAARALYKAIARDFNPAAAIVPLPPANFRVTQNTAGQYTLAWAAVADPLEPSAAPTGYKIYRSYDGRSWDDGLTIGNGASYTLSETPGTVVFLRLAATNAGGESLPTPMLAVKVASIPNHRGALLVYAFDRQFIYAVTQVSGDNDPTNTLARYRDDYLAAPALALAEHAGKNIPFDSATDEAVRAGLVDLNNYHGVMWFLGEESTADETFNQTEQSILANYLSTAPKANLFVSGSEIGWDLDRSTGPTETDRSFYHQQLYADFAADSAEVHSVTGVAGSIFSGLSFSFADGTSGTEGDYDVKYPDVLYAYNGSSGVLRYSSGNYSGGSYYAGVYYNGTGRRVINFGFPYERINGEMARQAVMDAVADALFQDYSGGGSSGPPNDHFAGAIALAGTSGSTVGSNTNATVESGEPAHANRGPNASIWYRYTAPSNGTLTVGTCGSSFDTVLAVYTGTAVSALTLIASNDDACGAQSRLVSPVVSGTTYRIAVAGYNTETGNVTLTWSLAPGGPVNDHFADAQPLSGASGSFYGSNLNATVETGEPIHFGTQSYPSIWYAWVAPAQGTVVFDTNGSAFDTRLAVYTGTVLASLLKVAADDDSGDGTQSLVAFSVATGVRYAIALDGHNNAAGATVLNWSFTPVYSGATIPWSQNFDSLSSGQAPSGWTILDSSSSGSADGVKWGALTHGSAPSPSMTLAIGRNVTLAQNDWAITPALYLVGGNTYRLSFYYLNRQNGYPESMEVKWGLSPTADGLTSGTLFHNAAIDLVPYQWTQYTKDFTPAATGDYYIGFHCYSPANRVGLRIDSVAVTLVSAAPTVPSVTTASLAAITASSASGGGHVTSDGGSAVTSRGVCWSTSRQPTMADAKTSNGSGTGSFTSSLTGLTPYTTYFVRAYATNAVGTSYGSEVSFTTSALGVPYSENFDSVEPPAFPNGWVVLNANQDGETWFSLAGTGDLPAQSSPNLAYLQWNNEDPAVAMNDWLISPALQLTSGQTYQITYYYRARSADWLENLSVFVGLAPTAAAMTTNLNAHTGFRHTSYQQTRATFTPPASGVYYLGFHGHSPADQYAILLDTIAVQAAVAQSVPSVTTTVISGITSSSASGGGTVTSDGNVTVTARGVCWSTSPNPTVSGAKTTDGTGPGFYVSALTGLAASTTYYVRAYATNSVGTAYGSEVSFTTSAPLTATNLAGRHVVLSAGSNAVLENNLREDVLTAEFVSYWLKPYLERAGARVFTVRETGMQTREVIVDNTDPGYTDSGYGENVWKDSNGAPSGAYLGPNYRVMSCTAANHGTARWTPHLPAADEYPVYVRFPPGANRHSAATYTIRHPGGTAQVIVNQKLYHQTSSLSGHWLYLGTWYFQEGTHPETGSVELSSAGPDPHEFAIADAVRFGGGLAGSLPRWRANASSYLAFAGFPNAADYTDETIRPAYANWLTGLTGPNWSNTWRYLAIHTKNPVHNWNDTTVYYKGDHAVSALNTANIAFAARLLNQWVADMQGVNHQGVRWSAPFAEALWPKNNLQTSSTLPALANTTAMPAAVINLLDQDQAAYHGLLQKDRWRHDAARSLYKSITRDFLGDNAPILPLPPANFRLRQSGVGQVTAAWTPVDDPLEPNAVPTGYRVYTSADGLAWDGGTTTAATSLVLPVPAGAVLYTRVTAFNNAGESFATQTLAVRPSAASSHEDVLLVYAFDEGFLYDGSLPNTTARYRDDYIRAYAQVLVGHTARLLAFDSCSNEAVTTGLIDLQHYRTVIWILGDESVEGETFSALEQTVIQDFLAQRQGARLLVSGSHLGYDLDRTSGPTPADRAFLNSQLHADYDPTIVGTRTIEGVPGDLCEGLSFTLANGGSGYFGDYPVQPDILRLAPGDAVTRGILRYAAAGNPLGRMSPAKTLPVLPATPWQPADRSALVPQSEMAEPPHLSVHQWQQMQFGAWNSRISAEEALSLEPGVTPLVLPPGMAADNSGYVLHKKVFGWLPYWEDDEYQNLRYDLLSHVAYFGYEVNASTGGYTSRHNWRTRGPSIVAAAHAKGCKVVLTAILFSNHAAFFDSPTAEQNLITNLLTEVQAVGADGVNIDFEGVPGSRKADFTSFLQNLCTQFHAAHPAYEVSVALYAVDWNNVFNIPALNAYLDDFVIMGYDFSGSWSSSTGPNAPLDDYDGPYSVGDSVDSYLAKGVPPSKLILAVPYYGHSWNTGSSKAARSTVLSYLGSVLYPSAVNNAAAYGTRGWDAEAASPWYWYGSAGAYKVAWYDDYESLAAKYDRVNDRGIGGIGIWALGYDDSRPELWNLIQAKFTHTSGPLEFAGLLSDNGRQMVAVFGFPLERILEPAARQALIDSVLNEFYGGVDNTPPSFTSCPNNIVVVTSPGLNTGTATWTAPTAVDNVGVTNLTSTHQPGATFPLGVTSVTYTARDAADNQAWCSFTVTVIDDQAPVISNCPDNLTVGTADGTQRGTAVWTAPSAVDNVGVASLASNFAPGASFPLGETLVIYTASDAAGNSATCQFTITVVQTYESWAKATEAAKGLPPGTLTAPNNDYDGDGLPAIVEFALGKPEAAVHDPANAPQISTTVAQGQQRILHYTYTRRVDLPPGMSIRVLLSADLQNWYAAGAPSAPPDFTDLPVDTTGSDYHTWRASIPLRSNGQSWYFRLSVLR